MTKGEKWPKKKISKFYWRKRKMVSVLTVTKSRSYMSTEEIKD